jgi:curved DNA-binding protein CbpA
MGRSSAGVAELDRDLYEILGVRPSASPAEVTSAYRRRVRDLHPDSGEAATADPTGLLEVLVAFHVLRDAEQRAAYDAHRPRQPSSQPSGAVRIPVRHIGVQAPSSGAWLRAGPARFDPEAPQGSPPVPLTARNAASSDLLRLIDELFRRWQ